MKEFFYNLLHLITFYNKSVQRQELKKKKEKLQKIKNLINPSSGNNIKIGTDTFGFLFSNLNTAVSVYCCEIVAILFCFCILVAFLAFLSICTLCLHTFLYVSLNITVAQLPLIQRKKLKKFAVLRGRQ